MQCGRVAPAVSCCSALGRSKLRIDARRGLGVNLHDGCLRVKSGWAAIGWYFSSDTGYHPRVTTSPTFDTDPARLAQPFPVSFVWGFAASAYQIEGAAAEDGR